MSKILVINSGSATLKFKVFSGYQLTEEISGIVERIDISGSFLSIKIGKNKEVIEFPKKVKNHADALVKVLEEIKDVLPEITLVGHRVVHGGDDFISATRLNTKIVKKLERHNKLAPLHNPVNLSCIKSSLKLIPRAKQFAIFDTAYYTTIPEYARRYALPNKFYDLGIKKYGFHGISHKYAASEGAKSQKKSLSALRVVSCHLGGGCSVTATKGGKAVGTTMGFTPLEGLMMATRAGDMDASIPLYLINELGMSTVEIDKLFNKQSGLLGVAGTRDMREILSAAGKRVVGYKVKKKFSKKEKENAKLALEMFVYNIVRYIGQFAATMGGLNLVVFTGGVGERSPVIRSMVLKQVKGLGRFKSVVIPANEELMIAREVIKQK